MNSEQFNFLMALLGRFVDAFERDVQINEQEWDALQKELKNRKAAAEALAKMMPGNPDPDDIEILDMGQIFDDDDEEDEDEADRD